MRRPASILLLALLASALALPPVHARDGARRIDGSFLVSFHRSTPPSEAAALARDLTGRHGGRVDLVFDSLGGFSVEASATEAERLSRDPRVRSVQPDVLAEALGVPQPDLRHLERTDAYEAFDSVPTPYRGAGMRIAIVDTGVQASHPAFHPGQVVSGKSCVGKSTRDQEGHGTHTAGNAAGRMGIAHDAEIVPVRVFSGASLYTPISKVICGLNWVNKINTNADPADDIDVVNMSLAYSGASKQFRRAVKRVTANAVVVAAAGNNGGSTLYPARFKGVIAVTALGGGKRMASFSANGGDLTAPGVNIEGPENGGGYSKRSGTSRSSPMVAGAAAIVLAVDPAADVLTVLQTSGKCPDGSINGAPGNCSGRWKGDDRRAEPLINAYCAGIWADPLDADDPACGTGS